MSDADTVGLTVVPPEEPELRGTGVMSLVDHLSELRTRIVRSILAIFVGAIVGFWFGDQIVAILKDPLPYDKPLVALGIGDPFAIRLRIAIVVGIILAMPVIVWQIWAFVAPGLTSAERRTIRPWLVTIEQECNRKLIRPLERQIQFTEHNIDGLLRGDIASRYSAYAIGRNWGWLSANDVRERENMNPLPNESGDVYFLPMNMIPADEVPTTKERIESLGGLIRAGYDPEESLKAVGLKPIQHSGIPPVTVQPAEFEGSAQRGVFGQAVPDASEPDNKPEPEPTRKDAQATAKMIAALRANVVDRMGQMVRKETHAARRASKKGPEGLKQWRAEFYPKHAGILRDALAPAVQAHLTYVAATIGTQDFTSKLVDEYIARSQAELDAVPTEEVENAVDVLMTRWEVQRVPEIADALMTEEVSHALGN